MRSSADGRDLLHLGTTAWQPEDPVSRSLLDLAAGRPLPELTLDAEGWALLHHHGLVGVAATEGPMAIRNAVLPSHVRLLSRGSTMLEHLSRLLEALAEARVPAAILKGPVLDHHVYREQGRRTYTDIDLLVPPDSLDRALRVMASDPCSLALPPKEPKAEKREVPFRDPSGLIFSFDLHWDLFSYRQLLGSAGGATALAWEQAQGPLEGPFGPFWRLPAEAELAFLCAHALLDHRFRLILFRDLREAARSFTDWDDLADYAGRWGLRSTTFLSLLVAARAFEAPVPEEVLEKLRPPGTAVRLAERLLERSDLVRIDGHRPHLLNLVLVLQHDRSAGRARLASRVPLALPGWWWRTRRLRRERAATGY